MQPKQNDSSDVILILKDNKEIRTNRNELSAACKFFATLLNSDMRENKEGIIWLKHISQTAMNDVLEFVRSGSVKITPMNAEELVVAAEYFLLSGLKAIAAKFLEQNLLPLNCISSYYLAKKYQCEDLLYTSRKFIFFNFTTVAESQDFLNLESEQVEEWISSDEIAVTTEDDVFRIILEWITQSKSERKEKFEDLFRHVRLAFISRDYLCSDVVTNDHVKENLNCMRLVEDAFKGIYRSQLSHRKQSGTHLVVFTGKETLCYQPDEDKWYQLADAPTKYTGEFQSYQMCSFHGKLYVFPTGSPTGEIYDPSLNCWTELDPGVCPPDLKVEFGFREYITQRLAVTVVQGDMYCSYKALYSDDEDWGLGFAMFRKYNLKSNTWNVVSRDDELNVIVHGVCILAMDNYMYVLGGNCSKGNAFRVNIADNKRENIADLKMARCDACGIAARGKIFVAGGKSPAGKGFIESCEMYITEADEWHFIASLNVPRSGGSMVFLKGILYVVGGIQSRQSEHFPPKYLLALTVESYDFESNEWKKTTTVPVDKAFPKRKDVRACALNVFKGWLGKPVGSSRTGLLASLKHGFQQLQPSASASYDL